ncbi:hypothetical protein FRX31_002912, partial [Thalictrum thalictroides]
SEKDSSISSEEEDVTIEKQTANEAEHEKVIDENVLEDESDSSGSNSSSSRKEEDGDGLIEGKKNLSIKRKNNIVAYGRVHAKNGPEQVVHGVALGEDNVRVSIDKAKYEEARLPIPSFDLETVKDAVGTVVAWPLKLVTEVPKAVVTTRTKCDKVENQQQKVERHRRCKWKNQQQKVERNRSNLNTAILSIMSAYDGKGFKIRGKNLNFTTNDVALILGMTPKGESIDFEEKISIKRNEEEWIVRMLPILMKEPKKREVVDKKKKSEKKTYSRMKKDASK